jgi:hypothetical protein
MSGNGAENELRSPKVADATAGPQSWRDSARVNVALLGVAFCFIFMAYSTAQVRCEWFDEHPSA